LPSLITQQSPNAKAEFLTNLIQHPDTPLLGMRQLYTFYLAEASLAMNAPHLVPRKFILGLILHDEQT
jgi:hypothetical protein